MRTTKVTQAKAEKVAKYIASMFPAYVDIMGVDGPVVYDDGSEFSQPGSKLVCWEEGPDEWPAKLWSDEPWKKFIASLGLGWDIMYMWGSIVLYVDVQS